MQSTATASWAKQQTQPVLLSVLALPAFWMSYVWQSPWIALGYTVTLLILFAVCKIKQFTAPIGVLCLVLAVRNAGHISIFAFWPMGMIFAATALWILLKLTIGLRMTGSWKNHLSAAELFSSVLILLISLPVLIFYYQSHPQVAKQFPLPAMPLWLTPIAIFGIAAVNGFLEELVYRFILMEGLLRTCSATSAILLTAIAFGFLHYKGGFPAGYTGVFLTFLFGTALGIQYYRFKNIPLTWFTHSATDFIMFLIILYTK
ncbi:MAG: CPBP family intramembrane metalloprotease [Deltaproteobacteria bacterium]|nr:CPBP family intramembrane metalloprotease [Deltaproteobacteria bacterium]